MDEHNSYIEDSFDIDMNHEHKNNRKTIKERRFMKCPQKLLA